MADTQTRNEGDEELQLLVVDRLLMGGELCDPYIVNRTNTTDGDAMWEQLPILVDYAHMDYTYTN